MTTPNTNLDNSNHEDNFPWHIGVHDAHCHPTDTMASIASIPDMKAASLTVMSTRGQDQDLVFQIAQSISPHNPDTDTNTPENPPKVLPCFGWHPWFAHQIYDDTNDTTPNTNTTNDNDIKTTHYTQVLTPPPTSTFISSLPTPTPLSQLLSETRTRLTSHPTSLIGEIGLDRSFRLPNPWTDEEEAARDPNTTPGSREGRTLSQHRVQMDHQKVVLEAQLRLAGEMGRPVSVHSVQAHGLVVTLLRGLWAGHERKRPSRRQRRRRYSAAEAHADSDSDAEEEAQGKQDGHGSQPQPLPFPPRICMHSYSGPTEPLKQFLDPTNPSDVYFSFSAVINFSGPSSAKVMAVIKALPDDRILVESDLHTAGPAMDELLEKVTRQVCELREWPLEEGVRRLAGNWRRFVFG